MKHKFPMQKIGMTTLTLVIPALCLIGCSTTTRDGAPLRPKDVSRVPDAIPKAEAKSRYGNPNSYEVFGKRYYVMDTNQNVTEEGIASWYGTKFHGNRTSSGEPYDMYKMTAAHKTLPLPTYARIHNLENGKSIVVKINDRGPFHPGRIVDLSYATAYKLGVLGKGTARVRLETITPGQSPSSIVQAAPSKSSEDTVSTFKTYLQVGAFSEKDRALQMVETLKQKLNRKVVIQSSSTAEPRLFKVQVGPIEDSKVAEELSQTIALLTSQEPIFINQN